MSDRLPDPIELTAYFVVSEALTNVTKHAAAKQGVGDARAEIRRGARSPMTRGGRIRIRPACATGLGALDATLVIRSATRGKERPFTRRSHRGE